MDHLAVLERLAAQEVERERQALAALDEALGRLRQEIACELAAAAQEQSAAGDLVTAALHARWLAASRQRRQRAEREIERLEPARARQMARLIERRLERKRLELLQARAEERRKVEARQREQREADEMARLRAVRGRAR